MDDNASRCRTVQAVLGAVERRQLGRSRPRRRWLTWASWRRSAGRRAQGGIDPLDTTAKVSDSPRRRSSALALPGWWGPACGTARRGDDYTCIALEIIALLDEPPNSPSSRFLRAPAIIAT